MTAAKGAMERVLGEAVEKKSSCRILHTQQWRAWAQMCHGGRQFKSMPWQRNALAPRWKLIYSCTVFFYWGCDVIPDSSPTIELRPSRKLLQGPQNGMSTQPLKLPASNLHTQRANKMFIQYPHISCEKIHGVSCQPRIVPNQTSKIRWMGQRNPNHQLIW